MFNKSKKNISIKNNKFHGNLLTTFLKNLLYLIINECMKKCIFCLWHYNGVRFLIKAFSNVKIFLENFMQILLKTLNAFFSNPNFWKESFQHMNQGHGMDYSYIAIIRCPHLRLIYTIWHCALFVLTVNISTHQKL